MDEMKPGTALPWGQFWDDIPHSEMGEGWTINAAEGSVAICDGPADQNEANARYIVHTSNAFPVLVEALEECRGELAALIGEYREHSGNAALGRADDALALARGHS